MPISSLPDGYV